MRRPIFLKVNHQLESRMPEIGLFGSEGGAPTHGVPTLSVQASGTWGSVSASVRRRRQVDVSKASRFIRSCDDPHSGALRPIVLVVVVQVVNLLVEGGRGL